MSIQENYFEVYNFIEKQFTNIKSHNSFMNYTNISPTDLVSISNITLECVEKLGSVSPFLIKKMNDSSISLLTIEKLTKLFEIHNELLHYLYAFNRISEDIYNNLKDMNQITFTQELLNYMYYDIINRYKLIILKIIDSIKRINIYVELVKNKINN